MRFLALLLLIKKFPTLTMSKAPQVSSSSSSSFSRVVHQFPTTLRTGILEQRYKRFLADITWTESKGDAIETVHCPNTGSMYKMIAPANIRPQCACSIADATKSKRKYAHTLEMIQVGETWVGVNSALANKVSP